MNEIASIIRQLEQQKQAIERALAALKEIGTQPVRATTKRRKHHMSPEGRARIAEAARRRWAAMRKG
jgi:hypothetical protein